LGDPDVGNGRLFEGICYDIADSRRNDVTATFGTGIPDQGGLGLVEQDTVAAAVGRILRVHIQRLHTHAGVKCFRPNVGDAGRDREMDQAGATPKCLDPDAGDAIAEGNRR